MMAFEMTSFDYDGSRKLPTINRIAVINPDNKAQNRYQYNPVPYNIGFRLSILVKNAEDGNKIVEQILPYFTPDWTTTAHLIPEMDVTMDIPVVLNNVGIDDVYDGQFETRRSFVWNLDFTLKGYIYGPIKTSNVIKFSNTEFFVATSNNIQAANIAVAYVQIQPGLTANGKPTSNASLSIPVANIIATDTFGYVTSITEKK